jgi:hypothetical protein
MFSSLRLITFADASVAMREKTRQLLADAAASTGAASTLFAPTAPGVYHGGDLIWRAGYRDESHYRSVEDSARFRESAAAVLANPARIRLVEHVVFARGAAGGASPRRGLYRVALFCANRDPSPERLARFASETAAMPRHVHSIRRWHLATPKHATGTRAWTHVWEQEYDDLAGLHGPYMMHPCHWGYVDRWFDPEDPDWLIDPVLCHSFCESRAPVIGSH